VVAAAARQVALEHPGDRYCKNVKIWSVFT
jgi:hypothetical protein